MKRAIDQNNVFLENSYYEIIDLMNGWFKNNFNIILILIKLPPLNWNLSKKIIEAQKIEWS